LEVRNCEQLFKDGLASQNVIRCFSLSIAVRPFIADKITIDPYKISEEIFSRL
jgi:hypothetical protein